jgi:hypothetical protein
MARKRKRGTCTYCGTQGMVTNDHVPPKNIFASPRPNNLITVPACSTCHGPTSVDDEYFRACLCMKRESGDHPDVKENLAAVFRALSRPEAIGFKTDVLSQTISVRQFTASGLYAGTGLALSVDLERLFCVVERTVRGLYFHETGKRILQKYDVQIHSDDSLDQAPRSQVKEIQETIINPLASVPAKVIGANVFWYRFAITAKPPISVWALTFYSAVSFLALIGPTNRMSPCG